MDINVTAHQSERERQMLTGINASILMGYTGDDHLITSDDEERVTDAVAGVSFRRASDALRAAERAYESGCDVRVNTAHIRVTLRTERGDVVELE